MTQRMAGASWYLNSSLITVQMTFNTGSRATNDEPGPHGLSTVISSKGDFHILGICGKYKIKLLVHVHVYQISNMVLLGKKVPM